MINLISVPQKSVVLLDQFITRSNNSFHSCLKEKIFFSHIPKCGGVSINKAITECYLTLDITKDRGLVQPSGKATIDIARKSVEETGVPFDLADDYLALKLREDLLLYYMCQEDIKYIHGHLPFSAKAHQYFSDKYAFVTVLRDPIKRWISAYFYNRYRQGAHRKIEMDIEQYMKSKLGRSRGHAYVKFVGGADGDYTSEQAITRAKENLHKFSVVGCLEYQEDFVNQFEKRFDRRLKIKKLNKSPASEKLRNSIITEEIKEEIREICKPDIEVYQYALDKFVKTKG